MVIVLVTGGSAPASAQTFLHNLLGLGQPASGPDRSIGGSGVPAIAVPARPNATWSREIRRYSPVTSEGSPSDASDERVQEASKSGKYRTLCVRTCDGYYFPIGNAVSRHHFMRDAAQCQASCGEEARLFYLPSGSDDVSTMLDLAGRSYVRMPTAFKYRKSLTDGCSCRPMPWSAEEQRRHLRYAEDAARAADYSVARQGVADGPAGDVTAAAGNAGHSPAHAIDVGEGASSPHPDAEVASELAETRSGQVSPRNERIRHAVASRAAERSAAPRRQYTVVRAPSPKGGGTSWFSPSSAKYTWPGDPPRR
mgnify:CR=1 FL=1